MIWDLEERIEDAFVTLLRKKITDGVKFYVYDPTVPLEYPCAVAAVQDTAPLDDDSTWDANRNVTATITVMTEAAPVLENGQPILSARDRNRQVRTLIMNVLNTDTLCADLIAVKASTILISYARVGKPTRGHDGDQNGRRFATIIPVDLIAGPA